MNGPHAFLKAADLLSEVESDDSTLDRRLVKALTALAYASLAQAAACAVNDPAWDGVARLPVVEQITEETPVETYASLPVGSLVRVTPFPPREEKPFYGKVAGYDLSRSKYRIRRQLRNGFGDDCFTREPCLWSFPSEVEEFDPSTPQRIEVTLEVDVPRTFSHLGEDAIAEMATAELETQIGTQDSPLEDGDLVRVRSIGWRRP